MDTPPESFRYSKFNTKFKKIIAEKHQILFCRHQISGLRPKSPPNNFSFGVADFAEGRPMLVDVNVSPAPLMLLGIIFGMPFPSITPHVPSKAVVTHAKSLVHFGLRK